MKKVILLMILLPFLSFAGEYSGGAGGGALQILMFGIIFLCLYLIPTTVAAKRNHHNMLAIFMLNLLGGWTFIGWAAALIWACTAVKSK
ncbi:superinfection immunity protein [Aeromonas veronii]|uniref:superinfection immunity protein n=1 Tax=Aeromonas veronii TaxID=654 RepID=UPI001E36E6F3|nr:superinfection immunity protein [Aeromonas veronii]